MRIYCDGSCVTNPGTGGWAFIAIINGLTVNKNVVFHIEYGVHNATTNNQMELISMIKSLELVAQKKIKNTIYIYSDSKYVIKGMNVWIKSWKYNDWKNSKNIFIKNRILWQELDTILLDIKKKHNVLCYWIRGHKGFRYNELVDQLAKKAARGLDPAFY